MDAFRASDTDERHFEPTKCNEHQAAKSIAFASQRVSQKLHTGTIQREGYNKTQTTRSGSSLSTSPRCLSNAPARMTARAAHGIYACAEAIGYGSRGKKIRASSEGCVRSKQPAVQTKNHPDRMNSPPPSGSPVAETAEKQVPGIVWGQRTQVRVFVQFQHADDPTGRLSRS